MITGLTERITSGAIGVLRLHYSADPQKRPGTEDGDQWLQEASQGYIGGTVSPRWRKEMEIDYGALGGTKLFPEWEQWLAYGTIVVNPFDVTSWKLYATYDHGWRNPSAFHVHGIGYDGQIVTVWEFYANRVGVPYISRIIRGESVTTPDGRRFAGNPYWKMHGFPTADPQIWAEDQPMNDGTNKSVAELFRRSGVVMRKGEKGGDSMVGEWLHGHYWKNPKEPLYKIFQGDHGPGRHEGQMWYSGFGAPCLIWELGQQRHKDVSARVALHQDQPEKLIDKDNHAWDSMKQLFLRFPLKPGTKKGEEKPNTFQWWRGAVEKLKRGERIGTFRV